MIDILSFERALNGNAVKVIHSVNNGEFGGETMIMWNPEKEASSHGILLALAL